MLKLIANGKDNALIAGRAAHQPEDGQEPHLEHPDEAADREPDPGRGLRGPQRDRLGRRGADGVGVLRGARASARAERPQLAVARASRCDERRRARRRAPRRRRRRAAARPRRSALEPPALGLERERLRVAVGQRRARCGSGSSPPSAARRAAASICVEQRVSSCGHRGEYQAFAARRTWAARPIFGRAEAHLLDACRTGGTMAAWAGRDASSLCAPRSSARSPLAAPRPRPTAPQPRRARLAQALARPRTSGRRARRALAVDLDTGEVVFALNPDRPLAPASNEKLAGDLRGARRARRRRYRFRTRCSATASAGGATSGTATSYLRARRPDAPAARPAAARDAALRARHPPRHRATSLADESWFDRAATAPGWRPASRGRVAAALGARRRPRRYRGRTTPDPALRGRGALRPSSCARAGSTSRGASRGARRAAARSRSRRSTPRRSPTCSRSWTATATTSPPSCVLKTLGAEVAGKGTTAAGAAVVGATSRRRACRSPASRIVDGSGLSRLDR